MSWLGEIEPDGHIKPRHPGHHSDPGSSVSEQALMGIVLLDTSKGALSTDQRGIGEAL